VDETFEQARKEFHVGNYRGAVSLLDPLLRHRAKEKTSPQQECDVVGWLSDCYRMLSDEKAALPHAQLLALEQQRSQQHAGALKGCASGVLSGPHGHHGGTLAA
jgi:hypothetical protein